MKNTSKKQFIVSLAFALLALACAISYNLIGSYVDENGFLHEQFAFIPLAYFFGILSLTFSFWAWLRK